MSRKSAERKIAVILKLAENNRGFTLSLTDEDDNSLIYLKYYQAIQIHSHLLMNLQEQTEKSTMLVKILSDTVLK